MLTITATHHHSDGLHVDQADHRLDVQRDVERDMDEAWLLETLRGTAFVAAVLRWRQSNYKPEPGADVLCVVQDATEEALEDEVARRLGE